MTTEPATPDFIGTRPKPLPCTTQPDLFHAPDEGRADVNDRKTDRVQAALELCLDCPLMIACRDWARANRQFGIWGGETDEERTSASAVSHLPAPDVQRYRPECGTPAGATWHRRYDPDGPCSRCKQAACDADRERRKRRREEIATEWPPQLAPREKAVLDLLAAGLTRKSIAERMGVQRKSIDVNVTRVRAKLRVFEINDLLHVARDLGLIEPAVQELVAA